MTWLEKRGEDTRSVDKTRLIWHGVTWHDATGHDMTGQDTKRQKKHDMTWHDMTWCDMTWSDVMCMTWYDMTIPIKLLVGLLFRIPIRWLFSFSSNSSWESLAPNSDWNSYWNKFLLRINLLLIFFLVCSLVQRFLLEFLFLLKFESNSSWVTYWSSFCNFYWIFSFEKKILSKLLSFFAKAHRNSNLEANSHRNFLLLTEIRVLIPRQKWNVTWPYKFLKSTSA